VEGVAGELRPYRTRAERAAGPHRVPRRAAGRFAERFHEVEWVPAGERPRGVSQALYRVGDVVRVALPTVAGRTPRGTWHWHSPPASVPQPGPVLDFVMKVALIRSRARTKKELPRRWPPWGETTVQYCLVPETEYVSHPIEATDTRERREHPFTTRCAWHDEDEIVGLDPDPPQPMIEESGQVKLFNPAVRQDVDWLEQTNQARLALHFPARGESGM